MFDELVPNGLNPYSKNIKSSNLVEYSVFQLYCLVSIIKFHLKIRQSNHDRSNHNYDRKAFIALRHNKVSFRADAHYTMAFAM